MQYQVPQFIEIEDKIFGPLTLKQFLYLAGGGGLCLLFFTLLPLYLAKKFHPVLFKDWDLIQEMRKFYREIYNLQLSAQDAERILNGLGPA